jgi:hypothetical protein
MGRRRTRHIAGALLTATAWLACSSEPEPEPQVGRGEAFYAAALASVEKAPELVRDEVLKTCDKWRHLDRPCDPDEVRRHQLECWVDGEAEGILAWTEKRKMGPRARALRTLLEVNLCMELRRWRKLVAGPDF